MGGVITEVSRQADRSINEATGTGTGTGTVERRTDKSTSSEYTRTTGGRTTGGRTTGEFSGRTSTGETSISTGQTDELSILNDEEREKYKTADEAEKKRLLRNAKKRQRYAEKKASGGQPYRPKKVNSKKNTATIDTAQLDAVIMTVSTIVASRPNCEHWQLSEKEVKALTEPLSKMIAESEALSGVMEHSNQVALIVACITIFLPRLVVSIEKGKEKKKVERTGQRSDTIPKKVGNNQPHKHNDRQPTPSGTVTHDDVSIYGQPLC